MTELTWTDYAKIIDAAADEARADDTIDGHDGPIYFDGTARQWGRVDGVMRWFIVPLDEIILSTHICVLVGSVTVAPGKSGNLVEFGIGYEEKRIARHVAQKLATIHINSLEATT